MITLAAFFKKILSFIKEHPTLIAGLVALVFVLNLINSCGEPTRKVEITRAEEKKLIKIDQKQDIKIKEKKNKKIIKHKTEIKPDGTKISESIEITDLGEKDTAVAAEQKTEVQTEKKSEHIVIEEKGKPQHLIGGAVNIEPFKAQTIKPGDVSGFIGQRMFDSNVFLTLGTTGKLNSVQLGIIVEF